MDHWPMEAASLMPLGALIKLVKIISLLPNLASLLDNTSCQAREQNSCPLDRAKRPPLTLTITLTLTARLLLGSF